MDCCETVFAVRRFIKSAILKGGREFEIKDSHADEFFHLATSIFCPPGETPQLLTTRIDNTYALTIDLKTPSPIVPHLQNRKFPHLKTINAQPTRKRI